MTVARRIALVGVLLAVAATAAVVTGRRTSPQPGDGTPAAIQHPARGIPQLEAPHRGHGTGVGAGSYHIAPATTRFTPGRPELLSFRILDHAGRPVLRFKRVHDKLLHLIVVRRDLTGYQHLHPQLGAGGVWAVPLVLPRAGSYRAFTDFTTDRGATTLSVDLLAPGRFRPVELPAARARVTADGYTVTLEAQAFPEGAGWTVELRFQVARAGWPVTGLQPYLGAQGHLVVLRASDLAYAHAHPQAPLPGEPAHHIGQTSGPAGTITFHSSFPGRGSYRLFLQFRHAGPSTPPPSPSRSPSRS